MIEIEKGIPVPKDRGGRKAIYPFAALEVGDSFAVTHDGLKNRFGQLQAQNRIGAAAFRWTYRHGGKFTVRVIDATTIRCWRIA